MVIFAKGESGPILAQSKAAEAHVGGKPVAGPSGLVQTHNLAGGVFAADDPQGDHPTFLFGAPEDDLLIGTSAGDLVFGHGGTDYIVLGAGVDNLQTGTGEDIMESGAHGLLFGDLVFDDLFDGDDADAFGALDAVNVIDDGEGEEIFAFGIATDMHDEAIRSFEAGDMVDLSRSDVFTLESGQAHTAPGQIVAAHEAWEVGEGAATPGEPAGHDATDLSASLADTQMLNSKDFNF